MGKFVSEDYIQFMNVYTKYLLKVIIAGGDIITAQIPDLFLLDNEEYVIAGVNGELFVPENWG